MTTRRRLLVVEDNRDLREVIRLQLEFGGYQVDLVVTAEEALERLTDIRPDALLVDIVLPGIDGDELCRKLRSDPSLPLMPILLYSAMAGSEARVKAALQLPAVRYQSKGGSTQTLHAALELLLAGSAAEVWVKNTARGRRLAGVRDDQEAG